MRAVVVLPLVPVTAAMGIALGEPGGKSMSTTGPDTSRGLPSLGAMCIRNPGAALTSTIPPPASLYERVMSGDRKSTPPTSSPTACTARTAISTLSGWTTSVMSVAVPPVERLPVERRNTSWPFSGTDSAVRPARASIDAACESSSSRVSTFSCPIPRLGSELTSSTSCATVWVPSPTTWPGSRFDTATSEPLMTSILWSSPVTNASMITLRLCSRATWNAERTSASLIMCIEMPRP